MGHSLSEPHTGKNVFLETDKSLRQSSNLYKLKSLRCLYISCSGLVTHSVMKRKVLRAVNYFTRKCIVVNDHQGKLGGKFIKYTRFHQCGKWVLVRTKL